MRLPVTALLFAFLFSAAVAAPFTSADFGFSADFPLAPQEMAPIDSERDATGKVISHVVQFTATQQGVFVASVTVDTFFVPYTVDAQGTLAIERDSFLRSMNGTATTVTTNPVNGNPAMQFGFDTPTHGIQGQGIVIIIQSAKPRIYVIAAARSPHASSADLAALGRFINSFRLTH